MISNEKIKQVFNAIKDNGLSAFDDESLARLLAILNIDELDQFTSECYSELNGIDSLNRIMNVRPLVEFLINQELYRIRSGNIYSLYIESLNKGEYREFFKSLRVEELADLKKYISYTVNNNDEVNVSATKKIIKMITKEIKAKEELRKPRFEDNVTKNETSAVAA